jgi:hemerythrin-like domain-containing protein
MHSSIMKTETQNLGSLLLREHYELAQLFEDLLNAVEANATEAAAKLWTGFDTRLRAHMELEEHLIVPAFGRAHPSEAAHVLEVHSQIRGTLLKLGMGIDLHLARADMVTRFVDLLREHAAHEDKLMYTWLDQHLDPHTRSAVLERVVGRLKVMPAH